MSTNPATMQDPPRMNVWCPHCRVQLALHPSSAGSAVACPKCGGKFQAPLPTAYGGNRPFPDKTSADVRNFASKKIAAGICGILLGGLGVHKFILGLNSSGTIMLVISLTGLVTGMCLIIPILACMAMNIIGLIEGIIYLTKSDEDFYRSYAIQKKEWF